MNCNIPYFTIKRTILLLLLLAGGPGPAIGTAAPSHATVVKEYDRVFTTYPYSDADPVPAMSRFYPYFRYDGCTDQPVQRSWKVVELSNDYLQVLILPEIGGKVWAAIEKTTGKSFLYFNHVVKFRNVAMRGPWTSGGLEANYGIFGHTPTCASPVDYLARQNPDGSASCIVGCLDLVTRSTWRLEINLPAAEASFTTRSFWHNGSGAEQSYYTWMNAGIKAAGNLQFVYPGTRYLGHDGKAGDWPINPANGHDISWYDQNNFGSYKSYHVFGRLAEFFGGYWHDEDFGMARCADYLDKPGRKIWIWGLSREGMVWEKLLTDSDGQYVEVQSGRLFNQTADESTLTPFKHKEFAPYATDRWTEHWMPVKGTKGFVSASPWGAMNVTRQEGRLVIRLCPARPLRDKLEVFDGKRLLYAKDLDLAPMQPVEEVAPLASPVQQLKVCVGGDKLQYAPDEGDELSRPTKAPADFDWTSAYGMYLKGKESARERAYDQAAGEFESCLKKEPGFLPALAEMAALANRRADYLAARGFAREALSIDTYDPGANYQFGLASAALGREADAQDAFSIAALSPGWRSAACVELAKVFLRQKRYDRALACAEESLDGNRLNLDAIELQASICRLQGNAPEAEATQETLLKLDPLNHFARFEKYLLGKAEAQEFTGLIRNELPQETYLELAAWYRNAGLDADAAKVLDLAPPTAEVLYWLAYLRHDRELLARAEATSPAFVFPFRPEAIPVFEWARQQGPAWQPKYFLALLHWSQGKLAAARELLAACGEEPRFGPFYAARAQISQESAERDLQRAAQLDPGQWRYGEMLAQHDLKRGDLAAALAVSADYAGRFPSNGVLALLHAKTLLATGDNQAAAGLLTSLNLLPREGSTEGRSLFREAHLMLAVQRMKTGAFAEALRFIETARQWPEHLGAGKPYPEDLDERLEDWLAGQCQLGAKAPEEARRTLDRILAGQPGTPQKGVGEIIRALALSQSGRTAEAQALGQGIRLAVVQQDANPGKPEQNRNKALGFARQALEQGADVVLFHEEMLVGCVNNLRELAEPLDGPTTRAFQSLLRGSRALIIYGLTEREGDKYFISATVVSADGVLTNYHKTHLWWNDEGPRHEPTFYQPGDRLVTFNVKGAKCGLMICYDGDFPEMTRAYANLGCSVLFWMNNRPSRGHAEVKDLASRNSMIMATSCCCGTDELGRLCRGGSNITDATGKLLSEIWDHEGLIVTNVLPDKVPDLRAKNPLYRGQRPDLYR